ncbi:MAG: membrane dipeptidase [Henriciella sp.]|nr:membrane dipeptidase [Henriciella sp.]
MHQDVQNSRKIIVTSLLASLFLGACTTGTTELSPMERAEAIHAEAIVLDAHADIVTPSIAPNFLDANGLSKTHPDKLIAGGVDVVVMSLAVSPGPRTPEGDSAGRAEVDEKLAAILQLISENQDNLILARSVEEIEQAHRREQRAIVLSFQNARSLEGDIDNIDTLYDAGVRVFGLNHLGHNAFSDSSRPLYIGETKSYEIAEEHGGLSDLGRQAVARINSLGGVMDVSQSSTAATLEIIALSKAPIIASHSNVKTISNVTRNLSDEEIDRIGQTGGVIHIAPFGAYLVNFSDPETLAEMERVRLDAGLPAAYSYPYELYWELPNDTEKYAFLRAMRDVIGAGSVADLLDHIDYIVDRIGVDHVGIGTDFNHGSGIEGYMDASDSFNVTLGLIKRGYSADEIKKIWGGNFLRVLKRAERSADK